MFVDKEKTLSLMSIAFLLKNVDDPIVWRGPKKNGVFNFYFLLRIGSDGYNKLPEVGPVSQEWMTPTA